MARYTGPVCRLCRREGVKLFLKGERCDSPKCGVTRRDQPPGDRRWRRPKVSDYGRQLREKQKVKRFYGVFERQFRRYFALAERTSGNTGENLLNILERRLDNAVHKMGFAIGRNQARQMITGGHILVNGRRVTIPSSLVTKGMVITPSKRAKSLKMVKENLERMKGRPAMSWLVVTEEPPAGTVVGMPARDEISVPTSEALIVELLSK
jgi:small subunit ribosomal protein S4